jgi:thiamine-monophosphate kinase
MAKARLRTIADVGEFGLIARIERAAQRAGAASGLVLGIGDDAALVRLRPGEDLAASSDAFVEDVHFRWRSQSPARVGRRALAASLSDLAAMGARPLGCLLSLAAPASLPLARADGLVRGLVTAAREHACPLAGGNLSAARETSLSLTVLGAVARGRALTRRGARLGDRILVTGSLGGAALAVARAARGGRLRHLPMPRLAAGRALARVPGVGGCIDVSDGLEADLGHLLAAAHGGPLGAELDPARVPVPRGFGPACARLGLSPEALALRGGEDYELLFTARAGAPSAAALARRLGLPVTEIGRVVPRPRRGRAAPDEAGWRHF